jgi:hypothetical protein
MTATSLDGDSGLRAFRYEVASVLLTRVRSESALPPLGSYAVEAAWLQTCRYCFGTQNGRGIAGVIAITARGRSNGCRANYRAAANEQ